MVLQRNAIQTEGTIDAPYRFHTNLWRCRRGGPLCPPVRLCAIDGRRHYGFHLTYGFVIPYEFLPTPMTPVGRTKSGLFSREFLRLFLRKKLPKIKYSLTHISTCEQTVEKCRKPRKIKGLRRFFSGKARGKCERFTPFFPTFWGSKGATSPIFHFSGAKLLWKSGRFGGKAIKWSIFPQNERIFHKTPFFMQNFYKNSLFFGMKSRRF